MFCLYTHILIFLPPSLTQKAVYLPHTMLFAFKNMPRINTFYFRVIVLTAWMYRNMHILVCICGGLSTLKIDGL